MLLMLSSCTIPRVIVLEDPLSATEHNDLGVMYERKGMIELAEQEYQKAAALDRDWHIPRFNLGNLYVGKGDFVRAENLYRQAMAIDENDANVLNNLALALCEQGRCDEAMVMINRALAIEQNPEYLDTANRIHDTCESGKD